MKLPISWLKDYVDIDVSSKELADAMTMSGSMVEGIENHGEDVLNVKTGRIVKIDKHENADKMVVCQVEIGTETIQIVTAATNVFEGAIVPVALDGAKLPGGLKIKTTKLRGVDSFGMFCSVAELNITVHDYPNAIEDGILILEEDTPLGVDIRDVLGLNDDILEFEITSNRPDCMNAIGLGREAAVTLRKPFKKPSVPIETEAGETGKLIEVVVEEPELCPRYCAKIVKNVKIEPSPAWLRNRLRSCGVRSINNIVDITNYVMLEYGQPMHAFDLRYLEDNKIIVKRAQNGDKFITLDGQERTLTDEMLTICDGKKAVAVAGVMGGENSEIKEDTVDILFEGANFNYSSIRKTSKTLGLRTESSSRFDKGLDPETAPLAVQRACELVKELGAGEVVDGMVDVNFTSGEKRKLPFEPEKMNTFLGLDVSREYMVDILEKLEFEIDGDTLFVPTFRDEIQRMADVAEEIGRFYGYDKLPATVMCGTVIPFAKTTEEKADAKIKKVLSESGYYEALTYTFMSPSEFDRICLPENDSLRDAVRISNPLGEDTSIMRTTILPAMLTSLGLNYSKRNAVVRLFEVGKVFIKSGEKLPREPKKVVMGAYGDCDFYSVKGDVEVLLDALFISNVTYEPCTDNPSFHPGRCAYICANGKEIGMLGEIHPTVAANYEIDSKAYIAVLDFNSLVESQNINVTYKKLPKFPAVTRDLAVLCKDEIPVGHMQETIKKYGGKILEDVQLFDIYKGKQIPEDMKSVAFSITFRAADRTLVDEDVNKAFNKIVDKLNAEHGAELRL